MPDHDIVGSTLRVPPDDTALEEYWRSTRILVAREIATHPITIRCHALQSQEIEGDARLGAGKA